MNYYLLRLYKKTKTATGIVNNSPMSKSTMIAKLITIASRTIGKNNKDSNSLLSFKDAKTCLGDTSPERDLENQDLNPWWDTCLQFKGITFLLPYVKATQNKSNSELLLCNLINTYLPTSVKLYSKSCPLPINYWK